MKVPQSIGPGATSAPPSTSGLRSSTPADVSSSRTAATEGRSSTRWSPAMVAARTSSSGWTSPSRFRVDTARSAVGDQGAMCGPRSAIKESLCSRAASRHSGVEQARRRRPKGQRCVRQIPAARRASFRSIAEAYGPAPTCADQRSLCRAPADAASSCAPFCRWTATCYVRGTGSTSSRHEQ